MRPITLEISGVRSYRTRTSIEFPDGGLIGIVGDTGSGKSSILEAMVAALYARTSWKRGDLSELRNSSEKTMRIVFTFEVDGRRWRVTRTSSKNNYPPAVNELVCLEDEDEVYSCPWPCECISRWPDECRRWRPEMAVTGGQMKVLAP